MYLIDNLKGSHDFLILFTVLQILAKLIMQFWIFKSMCAATASITATATAIAASTAAPTTSVTASDANSKVNFKKFCGHVY